MSEKATVKGGPKVRYSTYKTFSNALKISKGRVFGLLLPSQYTGRYKKTIAYHQEQAALLGR